MHELQRRTFLRISAIGGVGACMAEPHAATASHPGDLTELGPGPMPFTLMVNGVARAVQAEPRATLAEVLRGPLGLTGTKIACNRGACSACTVWLDGMPMCSCTILAVEVGARHVTTIEGLEHGDELHPVQAAFIAHDAMQCGFCTPGMVMGCAALLQRMRDPGMDDVRAAISGHICRCGTYPHVIAATLAAAEWQKA
jgi:aerobic-type carbon monoxide dehydrogenase small subunit (CoxS/CutS family)